jgi:hypothetical protein
LGIAVGGVGGAVVALLGAVSSTRPPAPPITEERPAKASAAPPAAASVAPPIAANAVAEAPSAAAQATGAASDEPPVPTATVSATTVRAEPSAAAAAAGPTFGSAPALQLPTTRDALLTAEMYCDKRQDFDECERAAAALESGSAGPVDAKQAKRFRRIALTHLVAQCEADSAHACFIMAAKYRAGTELTASPVRAQALEKRGLELCRLGRSAPECPPPS